MRLIIELLVISVLLILFLISQNIIKTKQFDINKYKDSIVKINDKMEKIDSNNINLKDSIAIFKQKLIKKDKEKDSIEKVYDQKINYIESRSLSNLIDSTEKIIQTDTGTFILVTKSFYRKARICDYKLKKLQAKIGIYKDKLIIKDSIINIKDERVNNFIKKIKKQNTKIKIEKDINNKQNNLLRQKNNKITNLKMQRIIGGSIATGIIFLILL